MTSPQHSQPGTTTSIATSATLSNAMSQVPLGAILFTRRMNFGYTTPEAYASILQEHGGGAAAALAHFVGKFAPATSSSVELVVSNVKSALAKVNLNSLSKSARESVSRLFEIGGTSTDFNVQFDIVNKQNGTYVMRYHGFGPRIDPGEVTFRVNRENTVTILSVKGNVGSTEDWKQVPLRNHGRQEKLENIFP